MVFKLEALPLDKNNTSLMSLVVEKLLKEQREYIIENIIEMSEGRGSYYPTEAVLTRISTFLETIGDKKVQGYLSELMMLVILKANGYSQEYCLSNLEENSVKKGFDGLFLFDGQMWIAESKSTNQDKYDHKHTLDQSYNSLKGQIDGSKKNDPWRNALNHSVKAISNESLVKKLTDFSVDFINKKYTDIDDHNIILSSTLIREELEEIDVSEKKTNEIIDKYKINKGVIVTISLKTIAELRDIFDGVTDE